MAINITGKFKPQGDFALVDAADVEMPDGTRLSEFKPEIPDVSTDIPVIDLTNLPGLDLPNGTSIMNGYNTAAIRSALAAGPVKFLIHVSMDGNDLTVAVPMVGYSVAGTEDVQCTSVLTMESITLLLSMSFSANVAFMSVIPLTNKLGIPAVSAADNGKILEVVGGKLVAKAVADSAVATFVDEYISSALEGDY